MMKFLLCVSCVLISAQAFSANEESTTTAKHVIFVGVGSAERGDPNKSDDTPWSLGYLYRPINSKGYWGIDIAGEGTSLNNTSRRTDVVEQGYSLNLLVGRNFNIGRNWRAGAGVLLGGRVTGKSCPDSYLGYECYADEDPENEYKINYGAMLHFTFKQSLIGLRASGESSQLMLGVAF